MKFNKENGVDSIKYKVLADSIDKKIREVDYQKYCLIVDR